MTDARSARVALHALTRPTPDARSARTVLHVLVRTNAASPGPVIYWWDGAALQPIDLEASGWWDGSAIQLIDWEASGWWDGAAIQSLET